MKRLSRCIVWMLFALFVSGSVSAENGKSLEGIWLGKLDIPDVTVRLAYRFACDENGALTAVHDSPDYGITDIPVKKAYTKGDSVFVEIALFSSGFTGKRTGDSLKGMYRYGAFYHPITLKRVKTDPAALLDYMAPRLTESGLQETGYRYSEPRDLHDGWRVDGAEDNGIDMDSIGALIQHILKGRYLKIHSLLVVENGTLTVEEYFYGYDTSRFHPIHSITKGVVCTLAGIALEKGILKSINTPITDFFPEYRDLPKAADKSSITIEHLLTMSAGLTWNEQSYSYYDPRNSYVDMSASSDCIRHLFELPLIHAPGEVFQYNSGLMVMLAEIIRRASKTPLPEFADKQLFTPLDIGYSMWDYQADGRIRGGGGLHLRPRDLAKIASLYLHEGEWQGKRLISADWFRRSRERTNPAINSPYWNHWGRDVCFIDNRPVEYFSGGGFGGQMIYGFPELDVVVAITAGNFTTNSYHQEMIERFILPAVMKNSPPKPNILDNDRITKLDNLRWQKSMMSNVGCIKGCMEYFGNNESLSWLYGASGFGFALNIQDNVQSQSVGVWNSGRTIELCRNIGVEIETISGHKSAPGFAALQERSWNAVRTAIDKGLPCYGFNLLVPESYIIVGYDDSGYYFEGLHCADGYGPKDWRELGDTDIGWNEVHIVKPIDKAPLTKTVKDALQFAIDFADHPEQFIYDGYTGGLQGYDCWSHALLTDNADSFGVPYNAAAWSECRRHALLFLKEAKDRLPEKYSVDFDDAIAHYSIVSDCMNEVARLFPYEGGLWWQYEEYNRDRTKKESAAKQLERACDAEEKGIEALRKIVAKL